MTAVESVYWLASMGEKTRQTLKMIADYLNFRNQRCFRYQGLRGYYNYNKIYRYLEWHTAERVIRKLAEDGWLIRRGSGKNVYFCLSERLEHMLRQLGWLNS